MLETHEIKTIYKINAAPNTVRDALKDLTKNTAKTHKEIPLSSDNISETMKLGSTDAMSASVYIPPDVLKNGELKDGDLLLTRMGHAMVFDVEPKEDPCSYRIKMIKNNPAEGIGHRLKDNNDLQPWRMAQNHS